MYDVVIIGAGPIGLFSSFYASLRGLKTLTLESSNTYGGQLTKIYPEKPIYDLPGIKEIKAKDYIDNLYNQYLPYSEKNPILYNVEVYEVLSNEEYHLIKTNKGEFGTKTILIASGNGNSTPRKLEVENALKCNNILYRLDNVEKYKNKDIVVLGGGDTAVDIANMLIDISNVTIVHRRNEFRAHEESLELFKKKNGVILTPYTVESIDYDNNLKALNLINNENKEAKKLYCDYVFVSYGLLPNKNILNNILDSDILGILVNPSMQTSKKGIYAVGNCCSYLGKVKTIASGMGEVATAITSIHQYLFPTKNPTFYSSINKEKN